MEWISVEDRLPDPEKTVFVLSKLYGYQVDMLTRNSPTLPYHFSAPYVIKWMYPEPPTEQK